MKINEIIRTKFFPPPSSKGEFGILIKANGNLSPFMKMNKIKFFIDKTAQSAFMGYTGGKITMNKSLSNMNDAMKRCWDYFDNMRNAGKITEYDIDLVHEK